MPSNYQDEEAARRRRDEENASNEADRNRRAYESYSSDETAGRGADASMSDVPLVGWLTGADAREGQRRAADEANRQREFFGRLIQTAPTTEDLTPRYSQESGGDEFGSLLDGPSRLDGMSQAGQAQALDALRGLMSGGMTESDRQALTAQRLRQGQQLRGANQAALQQMGSRGMGGSGAEMAARLGGSQAYANANAMNDASIMGQSQNRALQAMQGYGQLSGQMYGQDARRRAAIDAYNQANSSWRRGREQRNTAWGNRQQDARTQARQTAYQNRERATAAGAGINPYGAGAQDRARQDSSNEAAAGVIGSIISEVL